MKNNSIFLKKIKPEMTDCRVIQIERLKNQKEREESIEVKADKKGDE